MITASLLATLGNLNGPGRYLHWSIFTVSVANLVLIAVMVVIFGAALILPFPGHSRDNPSPGGVASDEAVRLPPPTWDPSMPVTTPMLPCGRRGSGAGPCVTCRPASCSPTASPPTSPPGSTSSAWPPLPPWPW